MDYKNIAGVIFGQLEAVKFINRPKKGTTLWECTCTCGNKIITKAEYLASGQKTHCGCKILLKSGRVGTRLYSIYNDMKNRCYNSNIKIYKYYGGKGVRVCFEWLVDFSNFKNWALSNGYDEKLTIDRIDSDGDYQPDNCRWSTVLEQLYNRKNTRYVLLNNEKLTCLDFETKYNIPRHIACSRIKTNWTANQIINIPIGERRSKYKNIL